MADDADNLFKLAPLPKLSDTVYLETLNDIMQARDKGQSGRLAELCMEGQQLCMEAGLWHPENADQCKIDDLLRYLGHLHLDAQLTRGPNENTTEFTPRAVRSSR